MPITVYYRVKAATLTPKIWCQNDGAAFNWCTKNSLNFPEEIRQLTKRHLVFHFGAMNTAPIQCAWQDWRSTIAIIIKFSCKTFVLNANCNKSYNSWLCLGLFKVFRTRFSKFNHVSIKPEVESNSA